MTNDPDELVTVAEAAQRLGLAKPTIRKWVARRWVRMASNRYVGRRETVLLRWGDVQACADERRANVERYSTPSRPKAS